MGLPSSSAARQQDQNKQDQDKGKQKPNFLVARSQLTDPFFKESAVLMLPPADGDPLVVGLIINKPTTVKLSEIFPGDTKLAARPDTVYFGGPVNPESPGVIFRSSAAAKEATLLFGDIYLSFDRDFIKGLLEKQEQPKDLRLFLGRSQWAPAQLENEKLLGAWYSVQAGGNLIFSPDPQYIWRTLFELAQPSPVVNCLAGPCRLPEPALAAAYSGENSLAHSPQGQIVRR